MLASAVYLADRHSAAATAFPDLAVLLTPLYDAHQTHITALARELGTSESGILPSGQPPTPASPTPEASSSSSVGPSSDPAPTESTALLADLRQLELAGQDQAKAVCLSDSRYRAALLGAIAAARASHAEVLT